MHTGSPSRVHLTDTAGTYRFKLSGDVLARIYQGKIRKWNAHPANIAMGIRDVLAFAINPKQGSSKGNLSAEGFVALPQAIVPRVQAAIAKVS